VTASKAFLAATAVALLVAGAAGCASDDPRTSASADQPLTFAAVPSEQNVDPTISYQNIAKLLEDATGRKVNVVRSTDYNAVIEGMVSDKIDIAEFGPLSYVLAVNNGAKLTVVGGQVQKGRPPTYQSYGIAPKNSAITDLAGFRGKKVCFVDPSSTSGYLFPSAALLKQGIDPKKDVEPVMAGGHDNSATSVAKGTCEAGFAFDNMVDHTLIDKKAIKQGDLKIVWKSDPIPNSPIAVRSGIPDDVKQKLTDAITKDANVDRLVELGICAKTEGCAVTTDPAIWGYEKVTDATFDPIRDVCETTKNAACTKQD
jgi:phosphonate transport system substrate-binding protein